MPLQKNEYPLSRDHSGALKLSTEADARMIIDQLLKDDSWEIANKALVSTEKPSIDGRADYLLKNTRTQFLMTVIEGKRWLA